MIFRKPPPVTKPAFEDVVDRELMSLYRVAKTLTSNAADAEDLVGQTLYLAARAWPTFDGAHPKSWLIRILSNEHFGLLRKQNRHPEPQLEPEHEPTTEGYWQAIDWALVGDQLASEMAKLPEEYRLAVALCDIEQLTYEEAAVAMDVPSGTVRSRLYRGRNLLRSRLVHVLGELSPT